jgi:WD40 repeat protein/energy-coupling factor transporter ATP-binding protein EcfA2
MPKYDLFISHANADSAWVNGYLLDALQQAGVNYHTETAFKLGKPRIIEFENAIRASRRSVLILSPDYLGDDSHQFIDVLIQTHGWETATWPLILLILQPVSLPLRLKALVKLDATNADERERAIERLCDNLQCPAPSLAAKPVCPYPGMRSFSEAESQYFFGRKPEIQELLEGPHLRSHRFVTIIGPSGSGKSSLVFAGLLPALKQSGLFGAGEWQVHSMRPGEIPLTTLKQVLGCETTCFGNEERFPETLATPQQRLLLIIDQFEELFTTAKQEAIPFQQALQSLLKVPHCYMVLTVRADFYPELMTCLLWKTIQKHRQEVVPLDEAGLREAIVKPADSVEVFVETALVERLVADAAGEPGILPFVQETLVLLWERLERRFLPLMAYEALVLPRQAYNWDGDKPLTGLQVAMANRADATLADLEDQAIARRLFLRLIQFGEGRPDTRRQQSVVALRSADDDVEQFDATLEHLVAQRLLTRSAIESEADSQVDIAHEALINGWQQLQQWLKERRQAELTRRQLETKVVHWEGLKRAGGLLDAVELSEAESWLDSPDAKELGYSEGLLNLVKDSRAAIEVTEREKEAVRKRELEQAQALAEEQRKRADERTTAARKLRNRFVFAIVVAVIAILSAVTATFYYKKTKQQAQIALIEKLAAQSTLATQIPSDANGHYEQALLLAVQTFKEKDNSTSRNALLRVLQAQQRRKSVMYDHSSIYSVAFNPDGKILASGGDNNHIRLWDIRTQQPLGEPLKGHSDDIYSVIFSPDGNILVSGSIDGTARLWNVATQQSLGKPLKISSDSIARVTFTPDGKILALGDDNTTIRLWDVSTQQVLRESLQEDTRYISEIALSPNGKIIALGSGAEDGLTTIRLLDMETLQSLGKPLNADLGWIGDLAFSPDNQTLAAGYLDSTVCLWNVVNQKKALCEPLKGHTSAVGNVAFSPDGRILASGSRDKTIRLWDMSTRQLWSEPLSEHSDFVSSVAFTPDGKTLVSGSLDKTIRLWDIQTQQTLSKSLRGHSSNVSHIVFSPNSRILAVGSRNETIRLWDVITQLPLGEALRDYSNRRIFSFTFDSKTLVFEDKDGAIRLWDVINQKYLEVLIRTNSRSFKAISPDGKILAIRSKGGIRLQNVSNQQPLGKPFKENFKFAINAVFSPDNRILALVYRETIHLWDIANEQLLGKIFQDKLFLSYIIFSPDGNVLAVENNGIIHLWDVASQQLLKIFLHKHSRKMTFNSDGKVLASWSSNDIRLWDVTTLQSFCEPLRENVSWRVLNPDSKIIAKAKDNVIYLKDANDAGNIENLGKPLVGHSEWVISMAFTPDGKTLASGSSDHTVRLWDVATRQPLGEPLVGHSERVISVAFSPDGKTLASGSVDQTVRLWDIATRQSLGEPLVGHFKGVESVAFSPDGKTFASGSWNGTVKLWDINPESWAKKACAIVNRNFSHEEWQKYMGNRPHEKTCPDLPKDTLGAIELTQEARQLLKEGKTKEAKAKFAQAREWDARMVFGDDGL